MPLDSPAVQCATKPDRLVGKVGMTFAQTQRYEVTIDNHHIQFPPGEFLLLEKLMLSDPRRFVGKVELIETLYPHPDFEADQPDNVIKSYVTRIRRFGVPVETDWNFGYRIPAANRSCTRPNERRKGFSPLSTFVPSGTETAPVETPPSDSVRPVCGIADRSILERRRGRPDWRSRRGLR